MLPKKTTIQFNQLGIGYNRGKTNLCLGENLSEEVFSGDMIALIGENGVGKSTLIRTICGLQKPLSGNIYVCGFDYSKISAKKMAKQISLVSTKMHRTGRMKVKDLVQLGRFPYEKWFVYQSEQGVSSAKKALQQVEMLHHYNSDVTQLSDGEYQRVMIARALVQDTDVIVLDEPTAFLDLPNKYSIINLLWHLCKKNNKTIIFSSHDLSISMQFVDKLWIFNNKTLHAGTPEDLLLSGKVEQLFNSKDIKFDYNSNQFIYDRNCSYNVHIQGEGRLLDVTRTAIKRMGFNNECNKTPDAIVIIQDNDKVEWFIKEIDIKVSSVNELQEKLVNFLKK